MPAISTRVRQAGPQDAAACLAIYRPYVENTAVSWELDVPTVERDGRTHHRGLRYPRMARPRKRRPDVGFAYGHAFNRLPAYRWSVQTGLYIDGDHHRAAAAATLYTQLLDRLGERGYRRAFAGITQPNEASNEFHRSLGFQDAGLYRRVEWKLDRWHDVAWMQLRSAGLADTADPPGLIT